MPATIDTLTTKFPGAFTVSAFKDNARVELAAETAPAVLFDLLKCLKDECGFDFLADVAGIDYLNYPGAADRYAVVYALANTATAQRVFVKAFANDPDPELPSAVPLWKGAEWMEREVYDMFGVVFRGHPDLRRILMPSEFTSYPLRKDYPLRGLGERHNFPTITRAES
ncbi:NADH-quinone oxidoreductase subunit C [Urbifossiella limnaea]|uniref:NADH-quinone oxidoreductase subunit C n=1 Tax=Urbifossiella limnaea TaxID=2528023 RepID=A0A517XLN9_9BACT|nr:NADH-quinone oxidoreductase subunit C [Urbifossiella limnaea]QDU18422.1 NADH-quinone oxidoreductase subunit 5 [Urbifossiella limnaea]